MKLQNASRWSQKVLEYLYLAKVDYARYPVNLWTLLTWPNGFCSQSIKLFSREYF